MTPTESATGACTTGATPHVKNTYDTTQLGTQGSTDFPVGRLTKSVATTWYPDGSNAQVSELYQHDARGRLIDEKLSFPTLPSAWNITTALPSYKVQESYNDADQVTTTTTSTNPVGQGYTTTQVYDSTTGALTGLSDTTSGPADLATLSFNAQAQVSSINYLTSTSSALAIDQFGFDANLRPITDTANWQSGSGNGTAALFSQSRSFDPGSNLTSLTTTHAAVPGSSGSGGTETSNFCYDEQNRLVWAGNSGTQPGAGNGTCGSGTLSNGLTGASYSNSYVYTHLGQLYQGPLNGGSTQEQFLYCNSSTPHQLLGLYPTSSGATCSNYTTKTADYSSSYDAFGNVTSRTFSSTTGTLSYDLLDHLSKWFVSSTNQEQYVYDSSGNRILRRSTNSTSTSMTVYAFGLEEHQYSGAGTNQGNTYYYSLAGRLIGAKDANGTVFYMTDTLGSILASFTNTASAAALKGNQVFGPYGNARYSQGTINTAKGFTGQYNDSLTGLDYYGARYYDPVSGVFLSVDTAQGNLQGMNPYAYVSGNPETHNDPTGLRAMPPVCPSYPGCNAPVDKSTLFAGIIAGVGSASGNYKTQGVTDYVPPVVKSSPPTYSGGSTPQMPLSSCGVAQPLCGHYGVHFALYIDGLQISVPGEWNIGSGQPGGSDNGGDSGGNSSVFADTEGTSSLPPDAQQLMDDPYAIQKSEGLLTFDNPDAPTAFASALKRLEDLGGPLGDNLETTQAKGFKNAPELEGLPNGFRIGRRGWRLDWDPSKGAHFNWYDWTLGFRDSGLGRWGVEKFPGTYGQVKNGLLALPDIELMLIVLES